MKDFNIEIKIEESIAIILEIAFYVFLGWLIIAGIDNRVDKVVKQTVKEEIARQEWVKAAHEISEPSSEILMSDDCNSK